MTEVVNFCGSYMRAMFPLGLLFMGRFISPPLSFLFIGSCFQMSLRRSSRQKRPSSRVAEPVDDPPPPPPRRPRVAVIDNEAAVGEQPSLQSGSQDAVLPPQSQLPQALISQIVATVTAEVTRNIQHLLPAPPSQPLSSAVPPEPQPQLVPAAVSAAADVIRGASCSAPVVVPEPLPTSSEGISDGFTPAALSIDAQVPPRIKAKIWANEFIDLATLLSGNVAGKNFQLTINQSSEGDVPTLSLESSSKTTKINNISTWSAAFRIFVAIYTTKYPHEAPALMKYCDIVNDLASRGHQWRFYDENFRQLRQTSATSLSWSEIHMELWLRACTSNSTQFNKKGSNNNVSANPGQSNDIPRGFCYKFHSGRHCAGCKFKHTCFKCNGGHSSLKCNFRPSNQGQNVKSSSAPKTNPANAGKGS